jgi:hypothetical protein
VRTWRRWTEAEVLRLEALRLDGLTAREIAALVGRPYLSVRTRLYREGLCRPRTSALRWLAAFAVPHTIAGVAARLGTTRQVVKNAKTRLRRAGFRVRAAEGGRSQ